MKMESIQKLIYTLLVASCCVVVRVTSGGISTKHFTAVLTSAGSQACAMDPPYASTWQIRSELSCAARCSSDEFCTDFNYDDLSKRCDNYHNNPINYAVVSGCASKTVRLYFWR